MTLGPLTHDVDQELRWRADQGGAFADFTVDLYKAQLLSMYTQAYAPSATDPDTGLVGKRSMEITVEQEERVGPPITTYGGGEGYVVARGGQRWVCTLVIGVWSSDDPDDPEEDVRRVEGAVESLKDFDKQFSGWGRWTSSTPAQTQIVRSALTSVIKRDVSIAQEVPHALLVISVMYDQVA